jgi:hypothetical protein
MTNVQTLRIVYGHYNLTTVLLSEFFKPDRQPSVTRLWLESCSYAGMTIPVRGGLESVCLRRLHMLDVDPEYTLSRCGVTRSLLNGIGGIFKTTVNLYPGDWRFRLPCPVSKQQLDEVTGRSHRFLNDWTYRNVPEADAYYKKRSSYEQPSWGVRNESSLLPIEILHYSSDTLKFLTLDWVSSIDSQRKWDYDGQIAFFVALSSLTFPNLRSFQLRNAATANTRLPKGIYLLHPTALRNFHGPGSRSAMDQSLDLLGFMERHSKLQSLAWPMDRFFSYQRRVPAAAQMRSRGIIESLGRTLVALRVDSYYMNRGEAQSDESWETEARETRIRRRLFISEFAAYMTNLKHLKIEGGIPRDEKREIIRATGRCPLEKIVMIGTSFPIGNIWGAEGADLTAIDEGNQHFSGVLESEDKDTILASTRYELPEVSTSYRFHAEYGWPPGPPLIHTIAMHHASTITELKFCGYNGSPVLHKPLPITAGLLHHLRHFHNLRTLIMSFWLLTFFDGDWRDGEIIDYWLNQRKSTSTALVTVYPDPPSPVAAPDDMPMGLPEDEIDVEVSENADQGELGVTGPGAIVYLEPSDQEMTGVDTATYPTGITSTDEPVEDDTVAQIASPDSTTQPTEQDEQWFFADETPGLEDDTSLSSLSGDDVLPPLVLTTHDEMELNPWEQALKTLYSPRALATGVYDMVGPHLSMQARSQNHNDGRTGVNIRASFMVGVESRDIFDLDMCVDSRGVVLEGLRSPRDEAERYWEKLESRLWF